MAPIRKSWNSNFPRRSKNLSHLSDWIFVFHLSPLLPEHNPDSHFWNYECIEFFFYTCTCVLNWNQGTDRWVSKVFDCCLQCMCMYVCLEGLICEDLIARTLIMWPLAVMECDSTVLCSGSLSFQPAKPIKHTLPCFALHHLLFSASFHPPPPSSSPRHHQLSHTDLVSSEQT